MPQIQWLVDNANGKVIAFGNEGIQREQFGGIYSPINSPISNAPEQWERANGETQQSEFPVVFKGRYNSKDVELIDPQSSDPNAVYLMSPEITTIYQP